MPSVMNSRNHQSKIDQWPSGFIDADEMVDLGSILDWVKPKTVKIGIHSFLALRSASKGRV